VGWNLQNSMFDLIEKLRGKSERTKKLVAVGVAALCAGIIFIFWSLVISPWLFSF